LSDGEVAKNLADKKEACREGYRLLEERTEAFTTLFPRLIRLLLIKKFHKEGQTVEAAKQLIRAIH